jgi:cyclopropane fatty-acyl-phospholipid synthase-like methyltransferase
VPVDSRLLSDRFPRSSSYHPDWVIASASGGANSLWLTEWLAEALDLKPGMKVLDLGCGSGASSVFLRREYGVQVWAADLWVSVNERWQRVRDAGADDGVFPIHAEAHALPFAGGFFDAIVSIDSFVYYGTDDHYLAYISHFVKPGGTLAIAGAGMTQEITGDLPDHLKAWWDPACWSLHSAAWWRRHWDKTGLVTIDIADSMPDGWQRWLEWHRAVAPDNAVEIAAVEADRGRYLGYARVVARRRPDATIDEPVRSVPSAYVAAPLLREP